VRKDADATKEAILLSARYFLATRAHGEVTLKDIADRAGVSPPLIMKYFGSKERLFARVMSFDEDADALLSSPLHDLGVHMVRQVLTEHAERGAVPLLRVVLAPLHGTQGDLLRANFRTQVSARLAERLDGEDAALRADLAAGMVLGLGVMYGIARSEALRAADIKDVVDRYGPVVQAILTP
jgi:AcrR family transcriptional regulator